MKKQCMVFLLLMTVFVAFAQDEQKEIKKEEVVVEFSFRPTLSDVFKLKTSPEANVYFEKKEITYQTKSKVVLSDFIPTPKKVIYVNIDESKPTNFYNYVYGATGSYGNSEFEFFIQPKKNKKAIQYGIGLTSYHTQNGINNKQVDNGQWKLDLDLYLAKEEKKLNWRAEINFQNNVVHWYGLPNATSIDNGNKNIQQTYKDFSFAGKVNYKNVFLQNITPSLRFFSDDMNSSEVNLNVETELNHTLLGNHIQAKVDVQYLNGHFDQSFDNPSSINYSFFNIGITPSYRYKTTDFKMTTSLGLYLNSSQEKAKTNFLLLPKVQIDVALIKDIMSLRGGVRSELNQNSYASLVSENPFVSPTLSIETTHVFFDLFTGLDGSLSKNIRYELEGSYRSINNQPLFLYNSRKDMVKKAYERGNSFGVVYDDVNILSFKANVETLLSAYFKVGGLFVLNNFETETQNKAWNMSGVELSSYVNFHKGNWVSQLGINYVNGRYSLVENETVKLRGFLDLNLKTGYEVNKKLKAHFNLYNILNNNYELYTNYQVQRAQALIGLSYKF